MAEPDLSLTPELAPSPEGWLEAVLGDFDAFLKDHASCEKKASGMALAVASHYPDQPRLLNAMVDLAVEELTHYREVIRLLLARNITPGPDGKDPYINALNQHVRRGPENFLMDRLLMGAVVERRGAERFALIAARLTDTDDALAKFYRSIAASEHRHWELFYQLARQHCPAQQVAERFAELTAIEADIMSSQPFRAALH
jgi:tRNA-(ms[2]io[6]A)-hydroxylase